ncbi:aconitase family protein [Paracoccus sp. MBLB3053]|uniref:Aconitase family protein n=1 Tax=Paracoccus aurantius TaxID=3073814 RepID=A0ABU2HY13_9RHOB|nr:aconitase family protein [Paracoccus sp. MBLB3053]MDS9469189.1 aconitase family protein [Paracoccus sp. MBLB3053]
MTDRAHRILDGTAQGPVLALSEPLSFWGGVDPETGRIIDAHHPQHGALLTGRIVLMPTSRGSCSGSGVILDLVLSGKGPAAIIFSDAEDVATLGALIADRLFSRKLPVLRVSFEIMARLAGQASLRIDRDAIRSDMPDLPIDAAAHDGLELSDGDQAILAGRDGEAAALSMQIICEVARLQGARRLTDISRGHIDGCIYAHPANLIFAERMADLGAKVRVPTTINAISVDRQNWQRQGVPPGFGGPASRLADAYVRMGCRPTFTCAPYILDDRPQRDEAIAWAESNAVIFANSVLGARTPKHPDFLDLCMAVTGRAPLSGVYLDEGRKARRIVEVELPAGVDDAFWPMLGYLSGLKSPDRIPLLRGVAEAKPAQDDLKALCAAFGTTSAAPMLHVADVTPEADDAAAADADHVRITRAELAQAWQRLNDGPEEIDLIAIGSPHASLAECRALAKGVQGQKVAIRVIVTVGRQVVTSARSDGTLAALEASGVTVIPDLCWCSITEPVFPVESRSVMTNSGKYAHYGPGLSGRSVRLGSLRDCIRAALTGHAPHTLPCWLEQGPKTSQN